MEKYEQVKFDEDANSPASSFDSTKPSSKMAHWIIKNNLAKTENGANIFLLILALVIFAVSIYIFTGGFEKKAEVQSIPQGELPPEIQQLLQ